MRMLHSTWPVYAHTSTHSQTHTNTHKHTQTHKDHISAVVKRNMDLISTFTQVLVLYLSMSILCYIILLLT